MDDELLTQQIEAIQAKRKAMRKIRYNSSRLDRYHGEVAQLRSQGKSLNDIRLWLKTNKRVNFERSTIQRWLKKKGITCGQVQ